MVLHSTRWLALSYFTYFFSYGIFLPFWSVWLSGLGLTPETIGMLLGAVLGLAGLALATLVYGLSIGLVIGSTLFLICSISATVGGLMPIVAKTIGADPAVFSNPFISTFCDATGLIIYFLIAKTVLGI